MRWRRTSPPTTKAALFSREVEAVCDASPTCSSERGRGKVFNSYFMGWRWKESNLWRRCSSKPHRGEAQHAIQSHLSSSTVPNDSEFRAGAFLPSVKITSLFNYACFGVSVRQRRPKVFSSRSAAVAVAGLIIPRLFQGLCWRTSAHRAIHKHRQDARTHAHARTCECGRWQSIMGEIGSYSPALPFSLSLSLFLS